MAAADKSTSVSELSNLLVVAAITKTLSKPGGIHDLERDGDAIPLSEDLVLRILRRGSLDSSRKLGYFWWCSVRQNYKHSACTYSQMFKVLCFLPHQHHDNVLELLAAMRSDGMALDSSTLKVILDGFIKAGPNLCWSGPARLSDKEVMKEVFTGGVKDEWSRPCRRDKDCANVECMSVLMKDYLCGCYVADDIILNKIWTGLDSNSRATWEECGRIKCVPYCELREGGRCDCK